VEVGPLPEASGESEGEGSSGSPSASSGGGGGGGHGKRRGVVKKLQQAKQQAEMEQAAAAQRAAAQQAQMLLAQQQRTAGGAGNGMGGAGGGPGGSGDFRQSPMFRRFFMAGNSDAPDAQPNTENDEDEDDEGEAADVAPEEIWDKVRALDEGLGGEGAKRRGMDGAFRGGPHACRPLSVPQRCLSWSHLFALRPAPFSQWPRNSQQVRELLPAGRASIPSLGEVLRSAAGCMESEMEAPQAIGADTMEGPSSRSSSSSGDEAADSSVGAKAAQEPTAESSAPASSSGGGSAGGSSKGDANGVAGSDTASSSSSSSSKPEERPATAAAAGSSGSAAPCARGDSGGAFEGLQPHTRFAAGQLDVLREVLALEPRAVLVQFSKDPQPALGTHRLWAADVLAVLLLAGHPGIDAAVADSGVLPAVVALALRLDKCSLLHFRALQMVDCCLRSREARLWRGLFEPGMGASVKSSAAGGSDGDALCAPLHEALAQIGEPRRGPSVRAGSTGALA
jgi:hypothetical protein